MEHPMRPRRRAGLWAGAVGGLAALPCAAAPAQIPPPQIPPPPTQSPLPPVPTPPAQPEAPPGGFPTLNTTPYFRIVPMNEARTIGFFTSLFPDCASQGPVVARLLDAPKHGSVRFAAEASFPRYAPGSPLASCNARKVEGLKMTFEAAEGYEGLDAYRVLVIYPDGSATQLDVKVSIR
ncbi:hypothetical protein [Methylobacterium nonmethylotrophicum]|uniref:Uncharacterized protein n=1 Tax=Methylobacterium nonmethylotrophicum TaxID=1141884 RepID=A0A4Z0NP62_9HYPH|nr:hypothetical protein [Methylobacterium nonmethylotrophicum]TGD97998.1 hypothetical protein EU555_17735 [Methylobacterium nonmethylotrophicum]